MLLQVTTRQLVFMLTTSQHWQVQLRRFYRVSIRVSFFKKKYAFIEYLLVLPKCHATKMYVTKMSYYQNVCYQNVLLPKRPITKMSSYQNVLLPKCQLPKRPLPKWPLPKCLDTTTGSMHPRAGSSYATSNQLLFFVILWLQLRNCHSVPPLNFQL